VARAKTNESEADPANRFAQLIQVARNIDGLSSPEQLTILRRTQEQLELLAGIGAQTKGPASLLPHTGQKYFKPREAAEYLSSSASTLAKRRLYGGGPKFTRIGRAIRYAKSDLDQFMAANTVRSTSEEIER
jgi:predicted DNA-binding transcriptional regulator AlpA